MDFPHIKDTGFPNVNNVDVFKYQNNFDYARWQGKVSIKLLNVLWNSNYADVPGFESDAERDKWFDEQEGLIKTLETAFNLTPENSVRVPVPYNDAYRFNYLVVDMPMQTSETQPIDYELENTRVKRWYYFIDSMQQYAPNTTELYLSLDVWTTFSHTVDIPYLMLERGHAPMMQTTVSQFLANPIANNEFLLADDFNYGAQSVIQTSNYIPIGNGKKYVLFCVPYSQSDFAYFGGSAYSGYSTPPTYANSSDRWGYQIIVNDYAWKYGGADYSSAYLPISNQIQDGILNGCACYAIEGVYAQSFFNEVANNCVHFIHGIQAMFILDDSMFTKGTGFSFRDNTIYPVTMKNDVLDFSFKKEQFGFDLKYREITKLYTFPYSELEITDDDGNTFTARIENCGNVEMHREVSLVYPFLNYNVFFSGINGDGKMQYTWKNVNDSTNNKTMWASDFSKYMMNWEIPVYSIYVSSEKEYAANNYWGMEVKRAGAIVDYENAVRYANTTKENVTDTMATNTANVNRTTAKDVTNTAATQAGLVANKDDTNDNADLKVDTYLDGGSISDIGGSGGYLSDTYDANLNKLSADTDADQILMYKTAGIEQDTIAATATVNAGGAIGGGVVSGASAGAALGVPGAIIGGVASGVAQGVSVGMSAMIAVTKNQDMVDNTISASNAKYRSARDCIKKLTNAQKTYNGNCKDADNDLRDSTVNRFSAANGINNANESRNKTANDANASATQYTETNNADQTRLATIAAEKSNLVQKQREAESQYLNSRLHPPVTYSKYSGDFMPDVYKRRGVRFNIRTQTKAAIAQVGDAFLRYGYALHRVWDMSNGWHYGKHFTFWKAEDIWINEGSGLSGNAVNIIGDILLKGVTVWKDPNEIGRVSIYDNI